MTETPCALGSVSDKSKLTAFPKAASTSPFAPNPSSHLVSSPFLQTTCHPSTSMTIKPSYIGCRQGTVVEEKKKRIDFIFSDVSGI